VPAPATGRYDAIFLRGIASRRGPWSRIPVVAGVRAMGDPGLEPGTSSLSAGDVHIAPYLGDLKLVDLTPEVIARWQADRVVGGAGRVALTR
jgi:hypothetical protein